MELSKEQIQSIENRLEKNGLKYWDIRIEILDHLVSDIENRMENAESYKSALENGLSYMNLTGNLEALNQSKYVSIGKIVRKQYLKKIKDLLIKPFSLIIIVISFLFYFYIFYTFSGAIFKYVSTTILLIPVVYSLFLSFTNFNQIKKSGYLNYSSFFISFSFIFSSFFIQISKPDGIFFQNSEESYLFLLLIIISLNSIFSAAGILVHLKMVKKLKVIKEKLLF